MKKSLLFEIKNYSTHQLATKYKITVNDDGTVYDKKQGESFRSLMEWSQNRLDKYANYDKITV